MKFTGGAQIVGEYRYMLWRQTPADHVIDPWVLWVMLNPSTADADEDDPTIRKVRGFSERWGFMRFVVANLYALRSTDPRALWSHTDPVGPSNDLAIVQLVQQHPGTIVCAWGAHARRERADAVTSLLRAAKAPEVALCSLGRTKSGMPRHPLMLSYDTKKELFE